MQNKTLVFNRLSLILVERSQQENLDYNFNPHIYRMLAVPKIGCLRKKRTTKQMGEFDCKKLYEICLICNFLNECLMQDRCISVCLYGAHILIGED